MLVSYFLIFLKYLKKYRMQAFVSNKFKMEFNPDPANMQLKQSLWSFSNNGNNISISGKTLSWTFVANATICEYKYLEKSHE